MKERWSAESSIAVEKLRGIDPHLFHERGSHTTILVKSGCEQVAEVLRNHPSMHPDAADALASPTAFTADVEQAIFIYQLRGHDWTQIDGHDHYLYELPEYLSQKLGAQAFMYMLQDVTGGRAYSVYDEGTLVEVLTDLEVSPDEYTKKLERTAEKLGFYVAADMLCVNRSNHIETGRRWNLSDLQCAKALRALSSEEERQRRIALDPADEEQKLNITANPNFGGRR